MFTREEYLEVVLEQARCQIEFLHNCLVNPPSPDNESPRLQGGFRTGGYTYAFPDMTLDFLNKLQKILPERHYCIHSKTRPDCEDCQKGQRARDIVGEWE